MEGAPDDDYDVDIDLDAGFKVGRHDVESIRRPEPGRLPRGGGGCDPYPLEARPQSIGQIMNM